MTDPTLRSLANAALRRMVTESGGIDTTKINKAAKALGAAPLDFWVEVARDPYLLAAVRICGKPVLALNKQPPTVDEAAGAVVGGARSP